MKYFLMGFRATLPITTGVIPFGAVMGTVFEEAHLSFFQAMMMNGLVYAGASQLAAVDLMTKSAASAVVIVTGLIINLRFLLYSAAISPVVQNSNFLVKLFCAYNLTDQSFAVMSANQSKLNTTQESVQFYLGAAMCMMLAWQSAVVAGFIFGNFAKAEWALDYAVPLSFISLVIPTLKNKKYIIVAVFSSIASVILNPLPYKLSLIVTALLSITLASFLIRERAKP